MEREEGERKGGNRGAGKGLEAAEIRREYQELLMGSALLELGSRKSLWLGNRPCLSIPGEIWLPDMRPQTQVSPLGSLRARGDTEKDAISCQEPEKDREVHSSSWKQLPQHKQPRPVVALSRARLKWMNYRLQKTRLISMGEKKNLK